MKFWYLIGIRKDMKMFSLYTAYNRLLILEGWSISSESNFLEEEYNRENNHLYMVLSLVVALLYT